MSGLTLLDTRTDDVIARLRSREIPRETAVREAVDAIIAHVRRRGDEALLEYARKFDSDEIDIVRVSERELESATVSADLLAALRTAIERIEAFHRRQLESLTSSWEKSLGDYRTTFVDGIGAETGQRLLPVLRAGIYVPGGRAAYPSSVLMNAIPARVAGVRDLVVCTPARRDGTLLPAVLVALRELGIRNVYKVGGAAAIAGMALGTPTLGACDVVVGPGNQWVNEAKRQLWGVAGFDGYAGPSEVCVLVDSTANPEWAAADFITQIEHAPDNLGFLVGTDSASLKRTIEAIDRQARSAVRKEVILDALRNSLAIRCKDLDEACTVINVIAPEHLTLAIKDPEAALAEIRNAGCVLLGEWTPEGAADYCIGPSHTLPTAGAARFGSPVNVMTFMKFQSVSRLDRSSLTELRSVVDALAQVEGFPAHAFGVDVRFEG